MSFGNEHSKMNYFIQVLKSSTEQTIELGGRGLRAQRSHFQLNLKMLPIIRVQHGKIMILILGDRKGEYEYILHMIFSNLFNYAVLIFFFNSVFFSCTLVFKNYCHSVESNTSKNELSWYLKPLCVVVKTQGCFKKNPLCRFVYVITLRNIGKASVLARLKTESSVVHYTIYI